MIRTTQARCMVRHRSIDIEFSPRWSARALVVPPKVDGAELVAQLALPAPRAVVVVNGSTEEGTSASSVLVSAIVDGVAATIVDEGWTAVTGATDAGIFSLLGRAAATAGSLPAPWIGVAPLALVSWPGHPSRSGSDVVPLEPHHSHFVLVEGDRWGDETPALLALTAALGRTGAPTAAVIAGGGAVARQELSGHARAERPIVALRGTGRLADEIAEATGNDAPDGGELAGIVRSGQVIVCDVTDGASFVAMALMAAMSEEGQLRRSGT